MQHYQNNFKFYALHSTGLRALFLLSDTLHQLPPSVPYCLTLEEMKFYIGYTDQWLIPVPLDSINHSRILDFYVDLAWRLRLAHIKVTLPHCEWQMSSGQQRSSLNQHQFMPFAIWLCHLPSFTQTSVTSLNLNNI